MNFERASIGPGFPEMTAYAATSGKWSFLILGDGASWTASYRLIAPTERVSASSTMMGPFQEFDQAVDAAETKLAELRRLA